MFAGCGERGWEERAPAGGRRVREYAEDGRDGLQCEVGGESGFLEGGELRARERAEGDYAADEGLEEGGAEEGAITFQMLVHV